MIEFRQVSKNHGSQEILRDVSFPIGDGEHVGVVGPNGAGKTTLFELIVGHITPDKGIVSVPRDVRLGYVRQQLAGADCRLPLKDYAQTGTPAIEQMHTQILELEARMPAAEAEERARILKQVGDLQTRYEAVGGYALQNRAEAALSGLGFDTGVFAQPLSAFSGGWQMRAELARVLASEPDILLLDEPSNYLDIPAIEWLQRYLRDFKGTLAMVSHDRYLLNTLSRVTIEVAGARAERYAGNYDFYVAERELRYRQRVSAHKNQERKREQAQRFIDRFRSKNTKAALVQSSIKKLEKMESVEIPAAIKSPGSIRLRPPARAGQEIVRVEEAGLTYDGTCWVLRHIDLRVERGDKTALVGLNGMGKTTLLRVLAGRLPLSEGKRVLGHKVVVGYQSQELAETMNPDYTVYETVKSTAMGVTDNEARSLLGGFGFSGDAVDKRVKVLSGGEKIRLAFARLLINPPNFLVLDEPTTHLDVQAREALERALVEFKGTICLVSHDIEFVRHVATTIIEMRPPGIVCYPGGYDYYHEKTGGPSAPSAPAPGGAGGDRKAERRKRAEQVQTLARQRRAHERGMAKAESRIEELEQERSLILKAMSAPAEQTDYATANQRLTEIQKEIDRHTREWEMAANAVEALQPGSA